MTDSSFVIYMRMEPSMFDEILNRVGPESKRVTPMKAFEPQILGVRFYYILFWVIYIIFFKILFFFHRSRSISIIQYQVKSGKLFYSVLFCSVCFFLCFF